MTGTGRRTLVCVVVGALWLGAFASGCSREELVRANLFEFRQEAVATCCECLAIAQVDSSVEERCTDDPDDRACLCGLDAQQCADELLGDDNNGSGGIRVVGACLSAGGACVSSCDGVLVYPE